MRISEKTKNELYKFGLILGLVATILGLFGFILLTITIVNIR